METLTPMEPYNQIFPNDPTPLMTLAVPRKTGPLPKGSYSYLECYCTAPGCDCRRVTVVVFNEKMKQKAVICFGFDGEGPFAGPYLDSSNYQAPYAPELLDFFVYTLNSRADWLARMYQQYREVRALINGKPYRGKAFPKPGQILYRVMPPPDLEAELAQSLQQKRGTSDTSARYARACLPGRAAKRLQETASNRSGGKAARIAAKGMAHFVELYARAGITGPIAQLLALQDELRRYLAANDSAGEELAALLPVLCQQSPEDDEKIEAALRLLYDTLDFYRVELEGGRLGAKQQMQIFQNSLTLHVFLQNEDLDLCMAVANILMQSRVELIPRLREASSKVMAASAARSDLQDLPGEDVLSGIARSFQSMGVTSPFEGAQEMLGLFAMNDPELQTALIGEMMTADDRFLRETAALMLFHHDRELSLEVSKLLAKVEGSCVTPETLRRLIVSRNWLPEAIRKNVDQAISNARKARVECAPLAKPPAITVYASSVDGSGAQGFHILVPDGAAVAACSLLLRLEVGVAECFVAPLKSKREVNSFAGKLKKEGSYVESSPDYLDLRVCHALAEGAGHGDAPNHSLVRIAELLGRDRWRGAPFDASSELLRLREEIAAHDPALLDEREYLAALDESARWHLAESVFGSWFEDDVSVSRELEASRSGSKTMNGAAAAERIVSVVLEQRRDAWLERLVVNTLWLRYAKSAPVDWHRMFHVAQAVADRSVPLKEIPLMVSIAKKSLQAYQHHQRARKRG